MAVSESPKIWPGLTPARSRAKGSASGLLFAGCAIALSFLRNLRIPGQSGLNALYRVRLVPQVLFLPMLTNRIRGFGQPRPVFRQFKQIRGGKELNAIWWWIAERFEQTRGNENWDVMRLTIQHPCCLLACKTRGQLPKQHQKFVLIIAHRGHHWVRSIWA